MVKTNFVIGSGNLLFLKPENRQPMSIKKVLVALLVFDTSTRHWGP
jgi:hypothetical protein